MNKQEVKKAEDHALITETIRTYAFLLQNWCLQRGTKQLEKHFQDCGNELVKRGIITQEDLNHLNS